MENITSTYSYVKRSYEFIKYMNKISHSDKMMFKAYLRALKKYENSYQNLDIATQMRIKLNNTFDLSIAIRIMSDCKKYLESNNSNIHTDFYKKIKLETERLKQETRKIENEQNDYQRTLLQKDVVKLLLNYMDTSELDIGVISLYPKDEEELQEKNIKIEVQKNETIVSTGASKVLSMVSRKS